MPIVDKSKSRRTKKRKKKSRRRLKDPESTGRKEAARLYPLDREAPCEWSKEALSLRITDGGQESTIENLIAFLQDLSGSKTLMPFCVDNKQTNRHHGPDKNPLNNESGNVHRICSFCHNRWHARNDENWDGKAGSD